VDVERFRHTVFVRAVIGKPGVRAKVRSQVKLQEYLDALNAKDGEAVTDRAIEGAAGGNGAAINVTKRLFIPVPPGKEAGVKVINDPYDRAVSFLGETKSRLFGRFGKAQPSHIMDGLFILPESAVAEYREEIAAAKARLEMEFLPAIEADYETAIERARSTPVKRGGLGPLFEEQDYAPLGDFLSAFGIDVLWLSLGVPDNLPKELQEEFAADFRARHAAASEEIFTALRTQFAGLIDHAAEVLTPGEDGKPRRFQASTLENIQRFCAVFQDRNLFGDDELQNLVDQARGLMTGISADKIRQSGDVRDAAAARFAEIKTALDSLVTVQAGRKFRLED
jgi:hypothetical protein